MSNLLYHIDRLAQQAKLLSSTSNSILSCSVGPFTNAALHASLEDIIRDIHPGELGLFTIVPEAPARPKNADVKEFAVERVPFAGATPLRRRATTGKESASGEGETEPEVYARAALKYLDRFDAVHPMPRARSQADAILQQLTASRQCIAELENTLRQLASARPPQSPKAAAKEEERRIDQLQKRLEESRKRRDMASKAQKQSAKSQLKAPRTIPALKKPMSPSPLSVRTPRKEAAPISPSPSTPRIRTTPSQTRRAVIGLEGSLMDESLGADALLGDVSMGAFESPVSVTLPTTRERFGIGQSLESGASEAGLGDEAAEEPDELWPATNEHVSGETDEEADKTIVPSKPPLISLQTPHPAPGDETVVLADEKPFIATSPTKPRSTKMKINPEVESIVSRVWATVGDVIMPGNPFNHGESSTNRPPKAKDTIAHLQKLTQTPRSPSLPSSPSSISSSSTAYAGAPSSQAISIAVIILALLSSPSRRAPLKVVREMLVEKGGPTATRAVYVCVAKRLIQIERGGGEQIIVFDLGSS